MRALREQEVRAGVRVELLGDVERFPHFTARKGSRGEVVEATGDLVRVRLDVELPGAEEWDNEVCWTPEDGYAIARVPDARTAAFRDLAQLDRGDEREFVVTFSCRVRARTVSEVADDEWASALEGLPGLVEVTSHVREVEVRPAP